MSGVVRFGEDGLVPVVVQDVVTGDVLMLAFMNADALRLTRETGRAHYWSRGRKALWRKGETSGNEQIVSEIRVNCEENSLLLLVRQLGAVCHTGFPTCYYRRVEGDESLTVVRERAFDPAVVYGRASNDPAEAVGEAIDPLAEATRLQFGAYAYLRDHDLAGQSSTSRRLRGAAESIAPRIAEELRELAGVLTGDHRHADPESDLRLESSQVVYWLLLQAIRGGLTWSRLRPDLALATGEADMPVSTIASLLTIEADRWEAASFPQYDLAAAVHAALALVGQACKTGNVDPTTVIAADLSDLRSRAYLGSYFGGNRG